MWKWCKVVSVLLVAQGLVTVAGCGESRTPLSGSVTLDGEPVGQGSVAFYALAGEAQNVAAAIENGKYEIPADRRPASGPYRVEINWPKPTGKQVPSADPGFMLDETREAIPPKFNPDSELEVQIEPGTEVYDIAQTSN